MNSSLSYGLNITKKPPPGQRPPPAKRKTIFDDDSGPEDGPDEEEPSESISTIGGLQAPSKPKAPTNSGLSSTKNPLLSSKPPKISPYGSLSAQHTSKKHAQTAQLIDPSIYDYDAAYDSIHAISSTKPAQDADADKDKRPKYMTNLLAAAEVRKRDQIRAKEKLLVKEREAEGDEFADKEKFVTGAYKRQQEEMRKAEEEERIKEEKDEERKVREGGGMKAFYKDLLGREGERHEMIVKAVEVGVGKEEVGDKEKGKTGKSESDLAKEKGAMINEEGEVVDKRQLLSAGLNPGGDGTKAKSKAVDPRTRGKDGGRRKSGREDESRAFEEQLLGKRSASPESEGSDSRAAKSRKMEDELLAAMGSP